jgi:hypothetical protein
MIACFGARVCDMVDSLEPYSTEQLVEAWKGNIAGSRPLQISQAWYRTYL